MKTIKNRKSLSPQEREEVIQKIKTLDLSKIKMKLMSKRSEPVSQETADEAEKWYKRFLILNIMYPDKAIVPTTLIDTMWHYHILDTQKYAHDCENVFGFFFHHYPYFGLLSEEDAQNSKNAFDESMVLFDLVFKEMPMVNKNLVLLSESCKESCSSTDCTDATPPECYSSCSSK